VAAPYFYCNPFNTDIKVSTALFIAIVIPEGMEPSCELLSVNIISKSLKVCWSKDFKQLIKSPLLL